MRAVAAGVQRAAACAILAALRERPRVLGRFERLLDPFPEAPPPVPPRAFFAFLASGTRGLRGWLVLLTVLSGAIGLFEAWLYALLGELVDWLSTVDPARLWETERVRLVSLAAILAASVGLIGLQTTLKHQALAANFPMRLRWSFHRMMLGQSLGFYQDEFAGRIATKVMQTALAVRDTWFIVTELVVFVVVYFATMLAVLGRFDPRLLAPFAGWLACYVFALAWFVPRLGRAAKEQADARSMMTGRMADAYTNIATVKLFSHARREAAYARAAMSEFLATVRRQMRLVTGFEIVNHALSMTLVGSTVGLVLWLWTRGEAGVGAVAASAAMALRLNGISHWVMWEMASLFENLGTVQDGLTTIAKPRAVVDRTDATPIAVSAGEIRFEDVSFSYGGPSPVVDRFSLLIRPGEKIGLVGRSGAGKSTIVNLLLRFYDVDSGTIRIDGQDVSRATQESLRARIGMVTQDTSLLHRSVRDNIVYGRPDATDEAMIAAAKRAEAHDFVQALVDPTGRRGYDAHVGERGVKLSGGQRQRIAIARVMLKDAPILLLDEATSALDSEVEAAIQRSLYRLMEGKTVVAIAHRLSTIAAMDRLVVLDRGRVVEEGTHASLLARGGLYARLWEHQSGGFLAEDVDEPTPDLALDAPGPGEAPSEPALRIDAAPLAHDRPTGADPRGA